MTEKRIGYITIETERRRAENRLKSELAEQIASAPTVYQKNLLAACDDIRLKQKEIDVAVARLWSENRTVKVIDD